MFYDFTKRAIDIVIGTTIIVLLLPIFIPITIFIKLTSAGPILYMPQRVGKGGKPFKMFKFRSMYMYKINGKIVHAQEYLQTNQKLKAQYQKGSFKLTNDPRITSIGKILRKLSLDELPQLFNVMLGDMSLVGPRAYQADELVHQQKVYKNTKKYVEEILKTRPGASGPWQVSGRSFINFDKRVIMDASYVKRKSVLYDILIIAKTPFAMISGKGAI